MDVTFSIAICASLVAIADGACSDKNALKVLKKPIQIIEAAEAQNACTRAAYEYLRSFPRPNGEPIAIAWNCSAPAGQPGEAEADPDKTPLVALQR